MGIKPPNSDHDLFLVQVWLWEVKCLKILVWPNHWAGHHWFLYKIHFLSHVTIWLRHGSLFLHRMRRHTSKRQVFWFAVSSWGTHQDFSPFQFASNAKQTIEWSCWVFLATSYAVVRGSASKTALSWSLSTSHGQPLHSSSSGLFSPLQNLLNFHYTVQLLEAPGPNALLMLWVV